MRIICGIVLYNPNTDRLANEINSIIEQVDKICLFDNGSENIDKVEQYILQDIPNEKIKLLKSNINLGIGAALNKIFEYANNNNYEYVLTLDHDSICPNDMIKKYVNYLKIPNVGMLCPNIIDKNMATYFYLKGSTDKGYEFINRTIQSGALVNVESWSNVGGFDEAMFIDFVDFDFCKRLTNYDYRILKVNSIVLDHELGKKEKTIYADFFNKVYEKTGKRLFLYFTYKNVFSNDRCYYSSRNNIIYIKRYKNSIKLKKEIMDYWNRIFRKILRSKHRGRVFFYSIKGFVDGIKFKEY